MVLLQQLKESIDFIRAHSKLRPRVGLTLGSGLSNFIQAVNVETSLPYKDIPHFAPSSVDGHPGNLILGRVEETPDFFAIKSACAASSSESSRVV